MTRAIRPGAAVTRANHPTGPVAAGHRRRVKPRVWWRIRLTFSVAVRCAVLGAIAAAAFGDLRWAALGPAYTLADELSRY